jgi:hypothetical protein
MVKMQRIMAGEIDARIEATRRSIKGLLVVYQTVDVSVIAKKIYFW